MKRIRRISSLVIIISAYIPILVGQASTDHELEDPSVLSAQKNVDKVRLLVENGTLGSARLQQAQEELLDAKDHAIISQALYDRDFTLARTNETVFAAKRLLERRRADVMRLSRTETSNADILRAKDDVGRAEGELAWAVSRLKLVQQEQSLKELRKKLEPICSSLYTKTASKKVVDRATNGLRKVEWKVNVARLADDVEGQ